MQHVSASKGYEDITAFLIEQGVDVNISGELHKEYMLIVLVLIFFSRNLQQGWCIV